VVIANLSCSFSSEQNNIQISEWKKEPAENKMNSLSPTLSWEPAFQVFQREDQPGRSGSAPPTLTNNLEIRTQLTQTILSPPMKVPRVFMKRMTERNHKVDETAALKTAIDFSHDEFRPFCVF